ncbi:unnamed protein product, partial [Mesorhabditis belari]|uniref:DM domain-containing protein n=1 Tax=Mesorhabditis belari TaxID=2138241 RepID=A0AAF3J9L7_9BILA
MNIIDIVPELFSSVSPSQPEAEKRIYYCQRCLNHGLRLQRKNHKQVCQFRHCPCSDCQMVDRRRELNSRLLQMEISPPQPLVPALVPALVQVLSISSTSSISSNSSESLSEGPLNLSCASSAASELSSPPPPNLLESHDSPGKIKERRPNCQRCAQHNLANRLKGHKRVCPFRECICAKCLVVVERQRLMADQIKLRRRQKKEKLSLQERPVSVSPPIQIEPVVCPKCTQQAISYSQLLCLLDPCSPIEPLATLSVLLQNCQHKEE